MTQILFLATEYTDGTDNKDLCFLPQRNQIAQIIMIMFLATEYTDSTDNKDFVLFFILDICIAATIVVEILFACFEAKRLERIACVPP